MARLTDHRTRPPPRPCQIVENVIHTDEEGREYVWCNTHGWEAKYPLVYMAMMSTSTDIAEPRISKPLKFHRF